MVPSFVTFSTEELIHRDELREIRGVCGFFFFLELVILFFRHVCFMFGIFWAHSCAPRPKALCSEVVLSVFFTYQVTKKTIH